MDITYKNISLKEMIDILVECILNKENTRPTFYYKRELYESKYEFVEIQEIDLLDTRFRTVDDDFSEFNWELDRSNIYIKE